MAQVVMTLSRLRTYPIDHLRGVHPWGIVLVVSLVGLRWLLVPLEVYGIGLMVIAVVGLWQIIGGIKSVQRMLRQPAGVFPAVIVSMALIWLVVAFVIALANFRAETVLLPSPMAPPLVLDESPDGRKIYVTGALTFAANTALRDRLEEGSDVETVVLNSEGGSVSAGRAIAFTILEFGLKTSVQERCFSACTLAFMAGSSREIGPVGRLGFHAYRFDTQFQMPSFDPDTAQKRDREYFLARGVSEDFLARIFQATSDEIWVPSRAELTEAGILAD